MEKSTKQPTSSARSAVSPLDEETKNRLIETELEQRKASEILDKMLENEEFKKIFIETAKKVIK